MKLRRYLEKDQPEDSVCLMSIMNIKFKNFSTSEKEKCNSGRASLQNSNMNRIVDYGESGKEIKINIKMKKNEELIKNVNENYPSELKDVKKRSNINIIQTKLIDKELSNSLQIKSCANPKQLTALESIKNISYLNKPKLSNNTSQYQLTDGSNKSNNKSRLLSVNYKLDKDIEYFSINTKDYPANQYKQTGLDFSNHLKAIKLPNVALVNEPFNDSQINQLNTNKSLKFDEQRNTLKDSNNFNLITVNPSNSIKQNFTKSGENKFLFKDQDRLVERELLAPIKLLETSNSIKESKGNLSNSSSICELKSIAKINNERIIKQESLLSSKYSKQNTDKISLPNVNSKFKNTRKNNCPENPLVVYKLVEDETDNHIIQSKKLSYNAKTRVDLIKAINESSVTIKKVNSKMPEKILKNDSFTKNIHNTLISNKAVNQTSDNKNYKDPIVESKYKSNSSDKDRSSLVFKQGKLKKLPVPNRNHSLRSSTNNHPDSNSKLISKNQRNSMTNSIVNIVDELEENNDEEESFHDNEEEIDIIERIPESLSNNNSDSNKVFYYCIKSRKELPLMMRIMKHRTNWELSPNNFSSKTKFNFLWKYTNKNVPFRVFNETNLSKVENIKIFSHLQYHKEISNKKQLFINFMEYCNIKAIDPFKWIPFTVILNNNKYDYSKNLKAFKSLVETINQNIVKGEEFVGDYYSNYFTLIDRTKIFDKVKVRIPKCFISSGKNYWILKPDNLCQGRLMQISSSPDEISKESRKYFAGVNEEKQIHNYPPIQSALNKVNNKITIETDYPNKIESKVVDKNKIQNFVKSQLKPIKNVNDKEKELSPMQNQKQQKQLKKYISSNLLIQKYIENPLLFKGRKFDIRVFLLVDHLMNLYIFKEGHLKTSSEVYDINSKETFIHITNYSLQKGNPNFEKFEKGNELSYSDFQNYLNEFYPGVNVYRDIMPKIKEMLSLVLCSAARKLNKKNITYTFEIYGCDLILDNEFNPYLFEINDNPGLSFSSPIIEELIPRILDDAFRLTLDVIYPTKYDFSLNKKDTIKEENNKYSSRFSVTGYSDEENLYEFMLNLNKV